MDIAKFIKNKKDILNLKTKYPDKVLEYLKKAHEESFDWVETKKLEKRTQGIEDSTHKIEKKSDGFVQLEYKENLEADIYKKIKYHPKELINIIEKFDVLQ